VGVRDLCNGGVGIWRGFFGFNRISQGELLEALLLLVRYVLSRYSESVGEQPRRGGS
jgi:hypothetical protein